MMYNPAQDAPVMASCTVCKQQIRMIKKNEQVFLKLRRRNERRERIGNSLDSSAGKTAFA